MAGAAAQNTGYGEWAEYESLPSTPRKPILWIQKSMTYGQVLVTGGMGFWRLWVYVESADAGAKLQFLTNKHWIEQTHYLL